jgi:tRNA-specific 2-thiouridylase
MRGHFVDIREHIREGIKKSAPASVLVAMSGGVDSSVAALLLTKAGFAATGLTMKNYCYGDADVPERGCCSVEAVHDARRECDRLGIPHVVADTEELFTREVIGNFLSEYRSARTPNPCVRCNTIVRFRTLLDYAVKLGIDYVATGHYARVFEREDGSRFVVRAVNREKDQSYFLSGVRGEILDRVLFPIGELGKDAVRSLAKNASMAVAEKPESQEVCFVPDGGLKPFLESRGVRLAPGKIENTRGEPIGEHAGLGGYTVGQRRHLGVAAGTPQYVVRLDRKRNVLVLGGPDDLLERELACTFEWIDPSTAKDVDEVTAQIRYRHAPAPLARLSLDGAAGRVEFETPQRAVCPGQTIVLYRGDIVVGSGVIDGPGPL